MRVFVAGATGVLGRRIVEGCADRGHDVIGLSRDITSDDVVLVNGGEPVRGDVLDGGSMVDAVDGADVVVHVATGIPTDTQPTEPDWELNDRVRRDGARNLVTVSAEHDVDRVVLQSIVWVARQPDGSPFDDAAETHPDRSTRSALDAENVVTSADDDEPTEYADFVETFADSLEAPEPSRVPAWLARWFVDDNLVRLLTRPMPTHNDRFREAFGWPPDYPTIEEGLDHVVERWVTDGTISRRTGGTEWTGG